MNVTSADCSRPVNKREFECPTRRSCAVERQQREMDAHSSDRNDDEAVILAVNTSSSTDRLHCQRRCTSWIERNFRRMIQHQAVALWPRVKEKRECSCDRAATAIESFDDALIVSAPQIFHAHERSRGLGTVVVDATRSNAATVCSAQLQLHAANEFK